MSYDFDGSNDRIAGTMTATYPLPVTLAAFVKVTSHSSPQSDTIVTFGNASAANNCHVLESGTVEHAWRADSRDSGGTNAQAVMSGVNLNGVWAGLVGKFTSNTQRDIYVQDLANTATNTTNIAVTGALDVLRIGEGLGAANDFDGLIAEVAIWNSALSDADITSYLAGTPASSISPANLIGYWPLSSAAATQLNLGLDAGGDLSVIGASFDADHPTLLGGFRKRRTALMGMG